MKRYNISRKAIVCILGFFAGFSSLLSIVPQHKKNIYSNIATDNFRLKGDMKKVGQDMYKAIQKVVS